MSEARGAAKSRNRRDLEQLVRDVNREISRKGLEWEDLDLLWAQHRINPDQHLKDAARKALKEQQIPDDLNAFRRLVESVNEILHLSLPYRAFKSRLTSLLGLVRTLPIAVLFGFVGYIVLGGIAAGESLLMSESGVFTSFVVLGFLILGLASLEGLQISVTTLQLKDLAGLWREYPRAVALHRKVCSEADSRRFLAGRQLLVIIMVFFAAQLTSFPNMTMFPGTHVVFPRWLAFWFEPLLRFGIPGALFVLWIGQLAPQFIANKNPLGFLNLVIFARVALFVSFLAESLGLTQPADWLSRWAKQGRDIPASAEEKYREAVYGDGYGVVGQKRIREVRRDETTLESHTWFHFTRSGRNRITDRSLMVFGQSVRPRVECSLSNILLDSDDREVEIVETGEERHGEDWRTLSHTIRLNRRNFQPGDLVHIRATIPCRISDTEHIAVSVPHEYILFRVKFYDNPSCIERITVTGYRHDELEDRVVQFFQEDLSAKLQPSEDGVPLVEFMWLYPQVGTSYMLEWHVEY